MDRYVPPNEVTSPADKWELKGVLCDEGEGRIAIAFGVWDKVLRIAIRWNGESAPSRTLGLPQSRGHPTWFILPDSIGVAVVQLLSVQDAAGSGYVRREDLQRVVAWLVSPYASRAIARRSSRSWIRRCVASGPTADTFAATTIECACDSPRWRPPAPPETKRANYEKTSRRSTGTSGARREPPMPRRSNYRFCTPSRALRAAL